MQPESNTRPHVTVPSLRSMKQRGEKIVVVTAYDASFAAAAEAASIDVVLVVTVVNGVNVARTVVD